MVSPVVVADVLHGEFDNKMRRTERSSYTSDDVAAPLSAGLRSGPTAECDLTQRASAQTDPHHLPMTSGRLYSASPTLSASPSEAWGFVSLLFALGLPLVLL